MELIHSARVENFELVKLKNGVMSLRALEPRETFHPGIGPVEEATLLHVAQQKIVERCESGEDSFFCIWDVGLGAAANALAAIRALKNATRPVQIWSFDKTLKALEFAIENAAALGYLQGFESEIAELLARGEVQISKNILWRLKLGDFVATLNSSTLPEPDSIFYDPYSPIGNPEMWNLDVFSKLRSHLSPTKTCLMTTYTRSTSMRVALLLAGFQVGTGCLVGEKDETTIVSNVLSALDRPLTREWLEKRVRVSHNSAPLRGATYIIAPINGADFKQLQALPQFA